MKRKIEPLWTSVGAFFLCPVASILFILTGILCILCWPFIPFAIYFSEKEKVTPEKPEEHPAGFTPNTRDLNRIRRNIEPRTFECWQHIVIFTVAAFIIIFILTLSLTP